MEYGGPRCFRSLHVKPSSVGDSALRVAKEQTRKLWLWMSEYWGVLCYCLTAILGALGIFHASSMPSVFVLSFALWCRWLFSPQSEDHLKSRTRTWISRSVQGLGAIWAIGPLGILQQRRVAQPTEHVRPGRRFVEARLDWQERSPSPWSEEWQGYPGLAALVSRLQYVTVCNDTYRYGWRCVGERREIVGCSIPICWELGCHQFNSSCKNILWVGRCCCAKLSAKQWAKTAGWHSEDPAEAKQGSGLQKSQRLSSLVPKSALWATPPDTMGPGFPPRAWPCRGETGRSSPTLVKEEGGLGQAQGCWKSGWLGRSLWWLQASEVEWGEWRIGAQTTPAKHGKGGCKGYFGAFAEDWGEEQRHQEPSRLEFGSPDSRAVASSPRNRVATMKWQYLYKLRATGGRDLAGTPRRPAEL